METLEESDVEVFGLSRRPVSEIKPFDFTALSCDRPYEDLLSIINWHDPQDLIYYGCPETKHTGECRDIFVRLFDVETEKEMHNLIYKVFLHAFGGTARKKSKYKQLAQDVFTWRNMNEERIKELYYKERINAREYLEKTLETH
jgi:hypothetical protein